VIERGLITSVPFAFATLVIIPWGRFVDRVGFRAWHFAGPAVLAGVTIPAALPGGQSA
jgi:MFS family permease